jgi:tetrahydromethanopterin S-methyltransferase subunit C
MSGLSLGAILTVVGLLVTYFAVPKQAALVFALIAAISMIVGYFPGNGLQNRTTWKTKIVLCVLAGILLPCVRNLVHDTYQFGFV